VKTHRVVEPDGALINRLTLELVVRSGCLVVHHEH
jgi:hypothetical protein